MIIPDPVAFRAKVIKSINGILNNDVMSRNIEKSIYNKTIQTADEYKIIKRWDNKFFVLLYVDKFKMIYFNLKNPELLKKILDKTFKTT